LGTLHHCEQGPVENLKHIVTAPTAVPDPSTEPVLDLSILLRELPGLVRRQRNSVVGALTATLGMGLLYLLFAEPVYNVGARLLVQHRDLPLQEQDRTIRGGTFLATQAEIINSPAVIRSALASVPPSSDYDGTDDERLQIVLASFGVTPVDRTNVLTLSHWSPVPEEAARILDATIESYRNFVRKTGRAESDALEILTRKEKELRKELSVAEDRYRAFRAESGLVGKDAQAFDAPQVMLARLGEQLIEARTNRVGLEARLEAAKSRSPATRSNGTPEKPTDGAARPSPNAMGAGLDADVSKIEGELWQAKMRVSGLLQNYGDAHPRVREARQEVTMWEGRLAGSMNAERSQLERELRAARKAEWHLKALYDGELSNSKTLDSQQREEQQLADEVHRIRELHQSMLGELRDWELSLEAVTQIEGGIDVRILEEPGLRVEKVWPSPALVLGPVGFVGLAGGLLLAVIRDRSDSRPA
jgi:succinoglycan biosynthesis transport protein ExoP